MRIRYEPADRTTPQIAAYSCSQAFSLWQKHGRGRNGKNGSQIERAYTNGPQQRRTSLADGSETLLEYRGLFNRRHRSSHYVTPAYTPFATGLNSTRHLGKFPPWFPGLRCADIEVFNKNYLG